MSPKTMSPKPVASKPGVAPKKASSSKPAPSQKIDVHDLKVPRRNKLLPVVMAALTLILAALVMIRLNSNTKTEVALTESATSSSASTSLEAPTFSVTVNGQEVALETQTRATLTLSAQPLSKISASQISNVSRQGSNWLVTFVDGSQSSLNASMIKGLPGEVQFQAEYRRDR